MKKTCFYILAILMVAVFTGCAAVPAKEPEGDLNESVAPGSSQMHQEEMEEFVSNIEYCYVYYDSLAEYCREVEHVVVADVVRMEPVERIGLPDGTGGEIWSNITPTEIQIVENLKGELEAGETILLRQYGGTFEGITEKRKMERITETYNAEMLREGERYILFINSKSNEQQRAIYPNTMYSALYGWIQENSGGVRVDARNEIVTADTFDGAIAEVKAAIAAPAHAPQE